jgi:hypothetical protein
MQKILTKAVYNMIPASFLTLLKTLSESLSTADINWALTGSTSFALQGVSIQPKDIDIQTDEKGAYAIERMFTGSMTEPVSYSSNGFMRSHFGKLSMDGIDVEIMGDIEKLVDGQWEGTPYLKEITRWIHVDGIQLPVLFLEYEVEAYRKMGRIKKAAMLAEHLS